MLMKRLTIATLLALPALACADDTTLDDVLVRAGVAEAQPDAQRPDLPFLQSQRPARSDTATLLRTLPGVSLQGAGGLSSLPAIRGLADDRIRIKVDDMDLISACGNHMNPPLSYIDPSAVGLVELFAGITPVSVGGDSIAGTIRVESAAPRFANPGEHFMEGELGAFYRSNGHVRGGNASATAANDRFSVRYQGSTVESANYRAGGKFKNAGPSYAPSMQTPVPSTNHLDGDEVGSSMYKAINQSISFALQQENHLFELRLGMQNIPHQGFPNQRMDMTRNDSEQANLRYRGRFDWGVLNARIYRERTRHGMNFLDDKAYWYPRGAAGMPMETKGDNIGAVLNADIALSERDLLRTGVEYQRYRLDDWWPASGAGGMSPDTFRSINDGQRDRVALFAEWEANWSPQWTTLAGVRTEEVKTAAGRVHGYNPGYAGDAAAFNAGSRHRRDHNWDLTLLARHTMNAGHSHEFGYARKTRSPNLYERYSWSTGGMAMNMINMAGDGNGYVGDPRLKPEVAHTISATAAWHDAADERWKLKLTPYYSYVENFINARRCGPADSRMAGSVCNLANLTRSDNFVYLKFANQDAHLYGIDVSGELPLASNTGYGSFSLAGVLNYTRGRTASGKRDELYNIMPLNLRLSLEHQLGSWNSAAELVAVSGKRKVSEQRNEIRTPGYALLNLRSSYEWKQLRFDVGIDNVFDRLYFHPLGGAYVGQGTTMPPLHADSPYGIAVPGMGRSLYAGLNVKF